MRRSVGLGLLMTLACPLVVAGQGVPAADSLAKAASAASAANTVAINFVWTLVAGFLVMFMQAGFAMVETGFTRAKNAAHTITMNFMVYSIAMLAYWAVGFALQAGGVGPLGTLGGYDKLAHEVSITIAGKEWGLFGGTGFFLTGVAYTAPVFAYFLFQMVFMDTAATIPTGALAERWKFSAFAVFSVFVGAFIYPIYANWTWGGGWLAMLAKSTWPCPRPRVFPSIARQLDLGRPLARDARTQPRPGTRPRRLCGLLCGAHDRRRHGTRRREPPGPASWQVQRGRLGERHPGSQHPDGADRNVHPRLRMVRLQRRLHAGRLGFAHRGDCHQHDAGWGGWKHHGDAVHVDQVRQARPLDDGQRGARRSRGDHGAVRVRDRAVGGADWRNSRRVSLHRGLLHRRQVAHR